MNRRRCLPHHLGPPTLLYQLSTCSPCKKAPRTSRLGHQDRKCNPKGLTHICDVIQDAGHRLGAVQHHLDQVHLVPRERVAKLCRTHVAQPKHYCIEWHCERRNSWSVYFALKVRGWTIRLSIVLRMFQANLEILGEKVTLKVSEQQGPTKSHKDATPKVNISKARM